MKLTPQQKIILNYLWDREWHCMAGNYMKDDRTRISELKDMGFDIVGRPCESRCGKTHSSRLHMRKLNSISDEAQRIVEANKKSRPNFIQGIGIIRDYSELQGVL